MVLNHKTLMGKSIKQYLSFTKSLENMGYIEILLLILIGKRLKECRLI